MREEGHWLDPGGLPTFVSQVGPFPLGRRHRAWRQQQNKFFICCKDLFWMISRRIELARYRLGMIGEDSHCLRLVRRNSDAKGRVQ